MEAVKKGSCLCGAVRFTVTGELKAPDACHCVQCRKHSGHYFASTDVPKSALDIAGIAIGGAANMALITLSPSIIAPPAGVNVSSAESLAAYLPMAWVGIQAGKRMKQGTASQRG